MHIYRRGLLKDLKNAVFDGKDYRVINRLSIGVEREFTQNGVQVRSLR